MHSIKSPRKKTARNAEGVTNKSCKTNPRTNQSSKKGWACAYENACDVELECRCGGPK